MTGRTVKISFIAIHCLSAPLLPITVILHAMYCYDKMTDKISERL